MSKKAKQLKQEKFKKLHPEGRKQFSLKTKIKQLENELTVARSKLENLQK